MILPQIILILIAIGIIIYAWGKRSNIGKVGSLMGRHHQPNPIIIDENELFVGRAAGENAIQEMGNGKSIVNYNAGWMNWQQKRGIPSNAIQRYYPPQCKQKEGIILIKAYDSASPLAQNREELQQITMLKKHNNLLLQTVEQLGAAIEEGVSPTIFKDRINKAMEMIRAGQEETRETKERELVATSGIKEETPKTKPKIVK